MDERSRVDARLQDCISTIWKAYRKGSMKEFNECFAPLYEQYGSDPGIEYFIKCFGLGLAGLKNRWQRKERANESGRT